MTAGECATRRRIDPTTTYIPPDVVGSRRDAGSTAHFRTPASLNLENQQEFVIGGFRPGSNWVDALLVGYYDNSGLRFAGKVRAGFVPHLRREVFKALKPHHVDDCPFVDLPNPKASRWGRVDGRGSAEACRISRSAR